MGSIIKVEHLSYVYERLDSTEEQRLVGEKNCYGKGMWAASLRYHKGCIIFALWRMIPENIPLYC